MTTHSYKAGDLVTITITGKVERTRGDAVVINAHGVEIPVLASQVNALTPLAQQILELIAQNESSEERILPKLVALREDIKQLCQKEAKK